MATASKGDTVRVEYTGTLGDGTVFDTSENREPLEFTLGEGQVIPGFEEAVEGMEEGEKRTTEIPSDQAYGSPDPKLLVPVPHDRFPDDIRPEVGLRLQVTQPNGAVVPVTVVEVGDEAVTLDANHPLAGEDLTFDITLVKVL